MSEATSTCLCRCSLPTSRPRSGSDVRAAGATGGGAERSSSMLAAADRHRGRLAGTIGRCGSYPSRGLPHGTLTAAQGCGRLLPMQHARKPVFPVSDHCDGERFFNPGARAPGRGFGKIIRWRLRGERVAWAASRGRSGLRPATCRSGARHRGRELHQSRQLPDPPARCRRADRSDLQPALLAGLLGRPDPGAASRHRARRPAAPGPGPALAQSLRPHGPGQPARIAAAPRAARRDPARQRAHSGQGRDPCDRTGLVAGRHGGEPASHRDAGAAFRRPHAVRPQPRPLGRLHDRRRGGADPVRRRFRRRSALARYTRPAGRAGRGVAADRGLRAALAHGAGAHGPGGSRAGPPDPAGAPLHRHPFRHVPAHRRTHRRATARARSGASGRRARRRRVRDPRFRRDRAPIRSANRRAAPAGRRDAQEKHAAGTARRSPARPHDGLLEQCSRRLPRWAQHRTCRARDRGGDGR